MTWFERLYPDVAEAGGLSQTLAPLGVPVEESARDYPGAAWSATAMSSSPQLRRTGVSIGNEERVFIAQSWIDRAHLAIGSATELDAMAAWLTDFHSVLPVEIALERHDFMRLSNHGEAYLSGSEVDWWWTYLLDPPVEHTARYPRLRKLIHATAREPKLRQLLPFTSHDDLCFSRCTRYPFSNDLPWIQTYAVGQVRYPTANYQYEVNGPGRHQLIAAADSAQEAAAIAAREVPEEVGRAIAGTADDLG